jgi:hypothetical protein
VWQQGQLHVKLFDVEANWDLLTVDGTDYSGTVGPEQVVVGSGSIVTWSANDILDVATHAGFEVCFAVHSPSPHPVPAPTSQPTYEPSSRPVASPTSQPTYEPSSTQLLPPPLNPRMSHRYTQLLSPLLNPR